MSALKSKKQFVLLPLIVALLIGVFVLFQPANKESIADSPQAAATHVGASVVVTQIAATAAVPAPHPADCAHCNPVSVEEQSIVAPVLATQPQFDAVFKGIAGDEAILSRADFDFLKGSQVGQSATFKIGGQTFVGTVGLVREGNFSSTYTVAVEGGLLTVTINRNNEFSAYLMLNGDSRVVSIEEHGQEDSAGDLLASEASVSDYLCAPTGSVYPLSAPQPVPLAGLAVGSAKQYPPLADAASIALTSDSTSGHVLYLDFDGEEVTGDWWNTDSGVATINALPHPRANDEAFVTAVWLRVVEDFAPFDIVVTTDEAVYQAAIASEQYLHMIITPTDDAAPGYGGVANIGSYSDRDTGIAWTFNQDEYSCAATISHEAGHAFGLSHDGPGPVPFVAYYGGHNTAYSPGWAPIMGAPWNDEFSEYQLEEVVQWSRGDYADADNQEDDVALIAGANNGFGFVADDYADAYDAGGALDVGLLGDTGLNEVGASGLISSSVDVDVFRFSAVYTGDVTLTAFPFDVESDDPELGSETQGADLAVDIRLLDENGVVLAAGTNAGAVDLASEILMHIDAGIYYLEVTGGGRGADPTVGFDDYGSLGQYTIVGALPTPPLAVFGGSKQTDPVLFGDTEVQKLNGTDFGFSYPSNSAIVHTFLLHNKESTPLTDISISLESGIDFKVVTAPVTTIPAGGSVYMSIAYDPLESGVNGIDSDTVMIRYEAAESEMFHFAVGGTSTQSADRDNYEDNDRWVDATDLTSQENVWLSDYKGHAFFRTSVRDMYEIAADNDELITVEVSYDATDGPITFTLENDYQVLGSTSDENGIIQFRVPLDFSGGQKDFVIIATNTADSSVYNAYDMRWSSIELIAGNDDLYEENDTQDQAFDLTGAFSTRLSEYLGEGISRDTDWYKIEIPSNPYYRMLHIAATFTHAEGDINIEVVDENGFSFFTYFSTVSNSDDDSEVLTVGDGVRLEDYVGDNRSPEANNAVMGVEPGTYYIRVYGDFAGNRYDLIVEPLMDDNYEVVDSDGTENDSWEDAFYLGETIIGEWLSNVNGAGTVAAYKSDPEDLDAKFVNVGDEDWYEFTVPTGAQQLSLEYLGVADSPSYSIHNASSGSLISDVVSDRFGVLTLTGSPSLPLASSYLIKVASLEAIANLSGYDFRVVVSYETPDIEGAVEDNYEQNDNFRELFDITSNEGLWLSSMDGYGTQLDPDWFLVTVPEGATKLTVKCSLNAAEGALYLDVSRKDGPTVATTTGGSDLETIVIDNPTPGLYAVAVLGENRGNNYNLFWDVVLPEDNYEENDVRADAFDLTDYERKLLRKLNGLGIQKDEDWYRIHAGSGTVELRATAIFTNADGDIDMELYNEDGYLFSRAVSTDDNETIIYANPPVGDYFVRIYYGNEGNEYDFSWAALNAAEVARIRFGEDNYEENDTQSTAFVLSSDQPRLSNLDGLGSQADDDWFEITIPEDNFGLYVECLFDGDDSDVDFEIYDDSGIAIIRRDSVTDDEILDLNGTIIPGTYHIRVYGPNLGTPYDLYFVAKVEDIYEENDHKDDTGDFDITSQVDLPLSDHGIPTQSDDDWYVIDVTGNYPYIKVTLDYVHLNGSIDFQVRDRTGVNVLVTADSTDDSETVFIPVDPGLNYIYVYGDDAYNTYDLTWELFQDDDYEENDGFSTAPGAVPDITTEPSIDAVQFDDDWFKVTVPVSNAYLAVLATFTGADGNIDLALYDAAGDPILDGDHTIDPDFESITLPVTAGDYFVKISGDNTNENYTLSWKVDEDDIYDEDVGNDTIGDASDFTGFKDVLVPDLRQFDEDWYEIVALPGEVSIEVEIEFLHNDGDLVLALYNATGELTTVNTDTDNELLVYGLDPYVTGSTSYFIQVSGQGFGTDYTLKWLSKTEDNYEEGSGNNTFEDASDLILDSEGVRISDTDLGYGTSEDEDWYLVRINSGDDGIVIEACFFEDYLGGETDIDIELFDDAVDEDGVPIALFLKRSVDINDVERIHYTGPAGDYYLRVFGDTAGNPYDLIWNSYKEDDLEIAIPPPANTHNDTPEFPRRLVGDIRNIGLFGSISSDLELYLMDPLTQLDEDWYVVNVEPGEDMFIVDLQFEHIQGDIDVKVYNRDTGLLVDQGAPAEEDGLSQTDNERLVFAGLDTDPAYGTGEYLICVYGYGIKNPKEDAAVQPWNFDPSTEDLQDVYYSFDPENIDLAESVAYGLANTYTMRWNSTTEDQYDFPTTSLEVNDDIDNPARPAEENLVDQYGANDSPDPFGDGDGDGIVDARYRKYHPDPLDLSFWLNYQSEYVYELVQFDEDWFEFTVDSGVTVNHQLYVSVDFDQGRGDLGLEVYKLNTATSVYELAGESDGTGDFEFVELFSDEIATYRIRVTGEDVGTPYRLTIRAFDDDQYEDNDDLAEAYDITELEGVRLYNIKRDEDYFKLSVDKDQVHLFPSVITLSGRAGYSYEVLDSSGAQLPSAYRTSPTSFVISPEAAIYYIRATGPDPDDGNNGTSYWLSYTIDNFDEYEDNDDSATATDLTRNRIEPTWGPRVKYLLPIQELRFDYSLASRLSASNPLDPFGHAILDDEDWYAIRVPSWTEVQTVAPPNGRDIKRIFNVNLTATIDFNHADGNIDMEIYEDDGGLQLLGRAQTITPSEFSPLPLNDYYTDAETLTVAVDPTDEQRVYYIKVYDSENVYGDNSYELEWSVSLEDVYEDNNFVEQAHDLTQTDTTVEDESTENQWLHEMEYLYDVNTDGVIDGDDGGLRMRKGYGNQRTDDWYAVVVSDGCDAIELQALFWSDDNQAYSNYRPDDVDLDFEVYQLAEIPGTTQRKPVLMGRSTDNTQPDFPAVPYPVDADMTEARAEPYDAGDADARASFAVTDSGIYFIRVYYDNGYRPYTFIWDDTGVGENDSLDAAIISDYLDGYSNGDWSYALEEDLAPALLKLPLANDDGDAMPNWAEFALALNASIADTAIVGQSIIEIDEKQYYQFEFLRRKEAVAHGYKFIVEETPNMVFDGTEAVLVGTESVSADVERVFYRCSKSMDEQDQCFFRLKVEEPVAKD
jgi:hypothetical protein